jgi:uncharacterized membrane protein YhaH (DUF805 family)
METVQWVFILFLSLLFVTFYIINFYSIETNSGSDSGIESGIGMLVIYGLIIVILVVTTTEMNIYKKNIKRISAY